MKQKTRATLFAFLAAFIIVLFTPCVFIVLFAGHFGLLSDMSGEGAVVIAFILAILIPVLVWYLVYKLLMTKDDGFACPSCGYDLRGNIAAGCPECGWMRDT